MKKLPSEVEKFGVLWRKRVKGVATLTRGDVNAFVALVFYQIQWKIGCLRQIAQCLYGQILNDMSFGFIVLKKENRRRRCLQYSTKFGRFLEPTRGFELRGFKCNSCGHFCDKKLLCQSVEMSEYENVIGGKLRLKGKALGFKGSVKKKKKHNKSHQNVTTGGNTMLSTNDVVRESVSARDAEMGEGAKDDDHLTPAQRRYLQQWEKIDMHRLKKLATKSHRDRIHEFNQYLANLTEHYDIRKVGPG